MMADGAGADMSRLSLRQVPIIVMYHGVEAVSWDPHGLCVTPARFAEQLTWLADQGLRGVSIAELVDAMRAGRERGLVGITFDDGYVNVLENAVPELLRHGFTATMFILSGLLGKVSEWEDMKPRWPLMSADQVIQVAAAGMEIGSHTATHPYLRGLAAERLKAEVSGSKSDLSELIGRPVRGLAYPYGKQDAAARRAALDAGYDYACAVETPPADLGIMALPRIIFSQRDGAGRMAAKKALFRSYTAALGTRRMLSYNPSAQAVKQRLSALARKG
jgi:peptidoglycan/xylan/chitin deacetylase (PgdA/CDA1 family)